MKQSRMLVQADLFRTVPARAMMVDLQLHHEQLVELISRLLWEVVQSADPSVAKEVSDEQDHR